jgi:hypothetical protein
VLLFAKCFTNYYNTELQCCSLQGISYHLLQY